MIIALLLLGGLALILGVSYFRPDLVKHVWETTLKDIWILVVGILLEVHQWLTTYPEWQGVVDPKWLPWTFMGMGILGILIRRINIGTKTGEIVIDTTDAMEK